MNWENLEITIDDCDNSELYYPAGDVRISCLCKDIAKRNSRAIQQGTLVVVDTTHAKALKTGKNEAKKILAHNGKLAEVIYYTRECIGIIGDYVAVKFLDGLFITVRPCDIKVAPKHERDKYRDYKALGIKEIITNDNAIIVKFADGSKEVAVCDAEDKYDARVGLLLCIAKHNCNSKQVNALLDLIDINK